MSARVAVLELPAAFGDVDGALARADAFLARAPCDLALLPEASLTGYVSPEGDFDLRALAEPFGGPTHRRVEALARAHRAWIAAPLVEEDRGRFFNGFVVVDPDGVTRARYRKRHPWFPETWATPGDLDWPSFDACGLHVTLAICFDVHFLRAEAEDALRRADLLLFPSAWTEEVDSRPATLSALARDFDVAIANANWGRGTPRVLGQGASMIIAKTGEILAKSRGTGRADAVI